MKPEPMYIVRTDDSLAKAPSYREFDSREAADLFIVEYLQEISQDRSGDIQFAVGLYEVNLGEQEDDGCFCCGDCVDCEKTANKEE